MTKRKNFLSGKWRIFVVDDHPTFREGLKKMIEGESSLSVCGEADAAPAALEAIRRLDPHLVTVDISLKGTSGLELIKSIKTEKPALPILTISMHDESLYAIRALRAGASGYVMKQESLEFMIHALHEVLKGNLFVSPDLNNKLLSEFVRPTGDHDWKIQDRLSDRELEIFEYIGHLISLKEIATKLNLSIKTVETHRAHIKEKLGIATARELAQLARGWVESDVKY